MSNKLVKHKESKEILTGNQKKIVFWICFIILSIAFITVWINILLTSKAFNTQMEEMVLGEDYYIEDIVITGKRVEDASADTISQNYFFYYNNGKVNDFHFTFHCKRRFHAQLRAQEITEHAVQPAFVGKHIFNGLLRLVQLGRRHHLHRRSNLQRAVD